MKKFIIIGLLLAIVVGIIIAKTKDNQTGTTPGNGEKLSPSDWLLQNYHDNVSQMWNLARWYKNNSNSTNPLGSALWDMYTNKKTISKADADRINNYGVKYEDVQEANSRL